MMTVLESLKKRAGFLIVGGLSFAVALVVIRATGGQPLFQPQSDFGIVLGLVLVAVFFVINDTRSNAGDRSTGPN
jgi:hypothetical protein